MWHVDPDVPNFENQVAEIFVEILFRDDLNFRRALFRGLSFHRRITGWQCDHLATKSD
ncbi:MAG: hypothetical protein P8P32_01865 [Akkermansiaceae bacterium]|nr:hypothetical protein [Akkermansiaceae bacterium]MDG2324681.1 hypothetical protein [Akkermansiaceae bacterium]